MSKVIMVTGGSRSGKSVIAEQKAKEYGKRSVLYLATAIQSMMIWKNVSVSIRKDEIPNGELMKDTGILEKL